MVKFSQDLWDSFDAIAAKTETSANVAKNLIDFLTERAKIEQAYAKSLAELSKKAGGGGGLFASKNDVVDKEAKSVKTVVLSLREETLHISNTHQEFSAKILSEVVRPVEGFLKSKDLDRKKNIQEGQKRLKAQADAKAAHDRAKDAYNKAGKESDAASEAHEKAQKDLFADAENKKLQEEAVVSTQSTGKENFFSSLLLSVSFSTPFTTNKREEPIYHTQHTLTPTHQLAKQTAFVRLLFSSLLSNFQFHFKQQQKWSSFHKICGIVLMLLRPRLRLVPMLRKISLIS
eukprot:TRINITY_DN2066_c0_g1_i1.p1 TRINITY_DN2066_c0_g1~~TRINITY_DN2066_c0_g1_i1.p1  ORF type:complete len:289 (-),score=73.37 TRINITY_DN2066_c0_g1_i1:432-1298(-)